MNTSRIVDNEPRDEDDMISTNYFIPTMQNDSELTNTQKQQFKQFLENKKKNEKQKFYDRNDYVDGIIKKDRKNLIKIEKMSVIDVDSRARDKDLYPYQAQFNIPLGKTFYNIKSIELISTSIPNTDQVITDTPESIRNNRISWSNQEDRDLGYRRGVQLLNDGGNYIRVPLTGHNLASRPESKVFVTIFNSTSIPSMDGKRYIEIVDDDTIRIPFTGGIAVTSQADFDIGTPIYTVDLTPGNYTSTSITTEIQKKMNLVKRRAGVGQFHYFTVEVNSDTDVITFSSYETTQLPQNPLEVDQGSGIITVNSPGHGFKSGEYVLLLNSKNLAGIPADLINQLHLITFASSNLFKIEVNDRASSSTASAGGTTVKSGRPSDFRLLFDTANSRIVENIGFPSEDSSFFLNTVSKTPLTTKTLSVDSIQKIGNYLRFTCPLHGLYSSSSYTITNITTGSRVIATTSVNHNLSDTTIGHVYYEHSTPPLDNYFSIISTSNNTFEIEHLTLTSNTGGTGVLKVNGDSIKLLNLKTTPDITNNEYPIENVTLNTFDILTKAIDLQMDTISSTKVLTKQVFVNHLGHGFNNITSIDPSGSTKALITTRFAHGLVGKYFTGVSKEDGSVLNTVDITFLSPHGLSEGDAITITNSTSGSIDGGPYYIQVLDSTMIRIPFVGGTFIGTCDVITGDTVIFSNTNSVPRIEIDSGGDVLYNINVINSTQFEITTGFQITTPGTFGLTDRDDEVTLHRIMSPVPGSSYFTGVPLSSLNSVFFKIIDIIDADNYMIYINDFPVETISAGGDSIVVSSKRHGYRKFQSNTVNGETTGVLYRSISLEGENYLFLISPNLDTVFSPGNAKLGDIFAKLLLNESPGLVIFDGFISAPKLFNPPMTELKELKFSIVRQDGLLFNFNNTDFSISLKVTEIVDMIADTAISSRTGTSDLY